MKRIVLFLFLVFVVIASARIVELYPSLDTIGRWKISQNTSYYSNILNYVIISNEKGKKELYPVSTDLTKKFIGNLLVIRTGEFVNQKLYNNNEKLNDINLTFKEIDDTLNNIDDPYKALIYLLALPFNKNPDGRVVSILGKKLEEIVTDAEQDGSKCELVMTSLDANIKTPIIDTLLDKSFNKHPGWKLVYDIAWEGIKKVVEDVFCKNEDIKESISKKMLDEVGRRLKAITMILKYVNLNYALSETENIVINNESLNYLQNFIKDYVFKYNMNIYKMAQDCDLSSDRAGKYRVLPNKLHKPYTFFQVFIIYGITHNYFNNIDLMNGENMYNMWLAAHDALELINRFGDGGNYKVYINIDDNNPNNSFINDKTYFTSALYWMLPLELKTDINLFYTGGINNFNSFYYNLYLANYNYYYVNPYYQNKQVYLMYMKNAKLNIKTFKLIKNNNNQYIVFSGAKVINLNKFDINLYIPIYKISYNKNDFLNTILFKSLKLGLIDYDPNIKDQLLNYVSDDKLVQILYRFSKITSIKEMQSKANINKNLQNIQWTSPITRGEFFKFLVNSLNLKQYNTLFLNNYVANIDKYICDSEAGCVLRKFKISTGKYSNDPLKIWQVLLLLERADNRIIELKRLQNETK